MVVNKFIKSLATPLFYLNIEQIELVKIID